MTRPLFVVDLDDTAIISKPDPKDEMNIGWATELSIFIIAATADREQKAAKRIYNAVTDSFLDDMGGFKNRSARELVVPLYKHVEQRLGIPAEKALGLSRFEFVKEMRARRLRQMLHYINDQYPQFNPGFIELYKAITSGQIKVDLAIATSNHHKVVEEIFKRRGLPIPGNIVSEDTILSYGLLPFEKPSPFSIIMADYQRKGWRPNVFALDNLIDTYRAENTTMMGNDPDRDGVMAESVGASYLHTPTTHPDFQADKRKGQLVVPNNYWLTEHLIETSQEALRERKPLVFTEAFFGRREHEIFPQPEGNHGFEGHFRPHPEREF